MVIEQSFITVTDKAAERAKAILTKGGIADAALRVFVASGGCSGYQFGMTIARNREADDIEMSPTASASWSTPRARCCSTAPRSTTPMN